MEYLGARKGQGSMPSMSGWARPAVGPLLTAQDSIVLSHKDFSPSADQPEHCILADAL